MYFVDLMTVIISLHDESRRYQRKGKTGNGRFDGEEESEDVFNLTAGGVRIKITIKLRLFLCFIFFLILSDEDERGRIVFLQQNESTLYMKSPLSSCPCLIIHLKFLSLLWKESKYAIISLLLS